jgi:hypothetical protein
LLLLPAILILLQSRWVAGDDILILNNGDRITGEVKKLELGELYFKADYGNNTFRIDWEDVERIESSETFIARTSGGSRLSGTLRTDPEESAEILIESGDEAVRITQLELVELKQLDEEFWGRFNGNLDFGLTLTKADETKQFTTRAAFAYLEEHWSLEGNINLLRSLRESTKITKRSEFGGEYRRSLRLLSDRWFGLGAANFLQSNELQLDLRSTIGGGIGNYLIQSNRMILSANGGAAWTSEDYEDPEVPRRNSGEAFGALEVNVFGIRGLDIMTTFALLPSFTEGGRIRMNFETDFRWKFLSDFYISLAFTDNYDSTPPPKTPTNDYIFATSIGWSYR